MSIFLKCSNSWKREYDKRTSIKRYNSRLKSYISLDNVGSKGIKVEVQALLNCIALIVGNTSESCLIGQV